MARVVQISPYFRTALDSAGITKNPSARARVGQVIGAFQHELLPMSGDFEALLPWPGSSAWAHRIPGMAAWLLYTFSERQVELLWLATHEPVRLE